MNLALSETVKHAADTVAVATPIAIFFNILPSVAALLSVVWLGLRIIVAWQEMHLNRRKDAAQRAAVKSIREQWNETLKEPMPKDIQKLLDSLK